MAITKKDLTVRKHWDEPAQQYILWINETCLGAFTETAAEITIDYWGKTYNITLIES